VTTFMQMADSVRLQAEGFLDAEGVAHDSPIPNAGENRTVGNMIAAPIPEDRITAALLVLRTVQALGIYKMSLLANPASDAGLVDKMADYAYRLRMYQDAMLSEKLRTRHKSHHARKPRAKGVARVGTAKWLADLLTSETHTVDDRLDEIVGAGGSWAKYRDLAIAIHKPTGEPVTSGERITNEHTIRFQLDDKSKALKVKGIRAAEKRKP